MSTPPERKFKQTLLSFRKNESNKKRKLEDDLNIEEHKCRKTCLIDADSDRISKISNNESINCKTKKETNEANDVTIECQHAYPIVNQKCESEKLFEAINIESKDSDMDIKQPLHKQMDNISELNKVYEGQSQVHETDETISENNCINQSNVSALNNTTDVDMSEETFTESSIKNLEEKKNKSKKLTPKQLQKKQESELKRKERERLKQEKERKKQEEKEQKEKKRLAEIEAKNEEKRLKEEEKKQKEEEKKQKEEEKKQKEEERKQKEEEKKQKEEEKRLKDEQEKKNREKTAALFTNFFLKNRSTQPKTLADIAEKSLDSRFMPFEVKTDMRLASVSRVVLDVERLQFLDKVLNGDIEVEKNYLYLNQIKSKDYQFGHSENTWPLNVNEDDDDVICINNLSKNEIAPKYRVKLLQFCENRRPAYWGTWRKRSKIITGRRPYKNDSTFFEYEVDSDDEWVEEEHGESLHGSDDEKESEDEYEVDNDVFVPHGYLSDEEGQNDEVLDKSPKSQKLKLNFLEKQFEAEMQEKTLKLKPRIFGCIWIPNSIRENQGNNDIENLLLSFRAVWNETCSPFCPNMNSEETTPQNTPSTKCKIKFEFPDSLIFDLIKLVHGNKNSLHKLSKEFKLYVLNKDATIKLSKSCIINKTKEISSWVPNNACWVVNDDVRSEYNLTELSYQENTWKYISNINTVTIRKNEKQTNVEKPLNNSVQTVTTLTTEENLKNKKSSITKFVKVLTQDEMQKQLNFTVSDKKILTPSSNNSIRNYVNEEPKVGSTLKESSQFKKRAILFPVNKNDKETSVKSSLNISEEIIYESNCGNCSSIDDNNTVISETNLLEEKKNAEINKNSVAENLSTKSKLQSETVNLNDTTVCSSTSTNVKEINDSKHAEINENISRVKQGKKYAKLITIAKLSKQ